MVDKRVRLLAHVAVVLLVLALSVPALSLRAAPSYTTEARRLSGKGDGWADLAVGTPGDVVGGHAGAGAVNAYYSSGAGPAGSSAEELMFDQDDLPGDDDAELLDHFGSALAAGDFNADGYDDLATGTPDEDVYFLSTNHPDAGVVQVVYGTPTGLDIATTQRWCQAGCGSLLDTAESGDHFGYALAAGDFNGDGFDDLAIGVPYEHVGAIGDAGGVNIVYGSPTGLSTLFAATQFFSQDTPADVEGVCEANDTFGFALAAGDFDDDGHDDLVIGVPYEDIGDVADAGAVNVLYGTSGGLVAGNSDQLFDQSDLEPGLAQNDYFGYALAAGRLGGDRHDDLVIGVRGDDVTAVSAAGNVEVMYGGQDGLSSARHEFYNQAGLLDDNPEENDYFGSALGIGDLNGDGYGDLVVGVPGEDIVKEGGSNVVDAGAINIVFGTSTWLSSAYDIFWHEGEVLERFLQANEQFGYAVAVGNIDDDVYDDVVVGVPYHDVGSQLAAGCIDMIGGGHSWPQGGVYNWEQDDGPGPGVPGMDDHYGMALAIGDWHGAHLLLPLIARNN